MKASDSEYLRFIDGALELCKTIPRYFSKFSNKIFNNHQHIVLLVLKQKLRTTYKDLIEILKISSIPLYIGLNRVPHYTTLIKFYKRIKSRFIDFLLDVKSARRVAVDSSGFERNSKSYYYRTAWYSDQRKKVRKFMKLSIAVDLDNQLILSHKIRLGPRNDNIDFKHLLKDLDVDYVIADKGYDSKKNRQFVVNKLKAIPVIPKRRYTKHYGYLRGNKKIDGSAYHQRSKAETVFSVIKRRYGSVLLSKRFATQKKELQMKLVAYNIDKLIRKNLLVILRVSY
jgi:transposase